MIQHQTAVDLHLLDLSIESFKMGDYIPVLSIPHKFDEVMLCNKQTLDLLKPDNDTVTLGHTFMTFTEKNSKIRSSVSKVSVIETTVRKVSNKVVELDKEVEDTEKMAQDALDNYHKVDDTLGTVTGDLEAIAGIVVENARNISTNATNISNNAANIKANADAIADIIERLKKLEKV